MDQVFGKAKNDIQGLKAISAIEISTGLPIGSLVLDPSFDIDAASAYNAEVVKAKIKAKNAMGFEGELVEIIIIELSSQIHIIQPTPNEQYIIYLAADKASTNIGMTRKVVKQLAGELEVLLGE
ncbi:MAG: hypothetical protein RIF33_02795 [Cyclobacteriaceae bacterium]